jgi:collagen type I alpha
MAQIVINSTTTIAAGVTLSAAGFAPTDGTPAIEIGSGATGVGSLLLTGVGTLLTSDGYSIAIGHNGTGTLTVAQGALVQDGNLSGQYSTSIGNHAGASGTLILTDAGSTYQVSDGAAVGNAGQGALTVENGATFDVIGNPGTNDGLDIGNKVGGTGTVLVTGIGSTLSASNQIDVGHDGVGSMTIDAGGTVVVSAVPAASLAVAVASGTTLGDSSGSLLLITGTGSSLLVSGTGTAGTVVAGTHNNGTIVVSAGGTLSAAVVDVGHEADTHINAGTGTISVDGAGSRLIASQILSDGGDAILPGGGPGTITVTNGAYVGAGEGLMWGNSVLSVDATGTIEFGTAGNAAAGAISVDFGNELHGAGTLSSAALVNSGLVSADAGLLFVAGAVTGSGRLDVGTADTLELASAAAQTVSIAAGGTLKLDNPASFTGTLDLGLVGGTLDLAGVQVTSATFDDTTLDVTTSNGAWHFATTGISGTVLPSMMSDGADGTDIVIACFASGTRIATAQGEIAVEALKIGDLVPGLLGGVLRPVVWIGYRRLRASQHPRPEDVWPVVVRAGAIGMGMPHRDLFLSPEHAILVQNVLIPVRCLINGTSIVQVPCEEITYWHVELAEHDAILAEGMPAESYLDTGNRSAFANGGPVVAVHPDFAQVVWHARACAEQLRHGPKLEAIRQMIDARAAADADGDDFVERRKKAH